MGKYGIFFLIVLLFGCKKSTDGSSGNNGEEGQEEQYTTVTVMTYNIWGARSGGIPDLKPLAEVINRIKPDLVALQEVDKHTQRNAPHGDIAQKLGALTSMDYFFAKAINTSGGEYGEAVLSRLPVKEKKAYTLGVTPQLGGELRAVARILVEKDGVPFYFAGTHLDHLSNEANRLKQARELVDLLKTFSLPHIVGGDMNALPESETMKIMRQHLIPGCLNGNCNQLTFPASKPDRTIDYILYAPVNDMSVQAYSVYTWANQESDHLPVVAVFRVKKKK